MTDRDLIIAAAEKVMEFEVITAKQYHRMRGVPSAETFVEDDKGLWRRNPRENDHFTLPFNPLSFDADAFMLVDALREQRHAAFVLGGNAYANQWTAWFMEGVWAIGRQQNRAPERDDASLLGCATADTRRRAIVLAALRAVGVEA